MSADSSQAAEQFSDQLAQMAVGADNEPLSLRVRSAATPEAFGNARCEYFEYSSRGDRVTGRLLLPADASEPVPLILFQHGMGGSKEAEYLNAAAPWIRHGVAIATIDFPLHGERADAKLAEHLQGGPGDDTRALWIEVARQAVSDLRRAVDALTSLSALDGRVAYAAFSLGAMLGTLYCASDPRPCAAALALAGGGLFPPEIDPCNHVSAISPRPILFINGSRDETVPPSATQALFESARDPKRIEWYDAGHTDLPGVALKEMWLFLRDQLELGGS
jgi:fermentation-respiration switch protein FrsA (DUF1100 family)